MKLKITMLTLLVAIVLVACSSNEKNLTKENETQNIKELVHEYSIGNIKNQSASITSRQLVVTDKKNKLVYDLPGDEFFVSIAPYIDQTHPCTNHSLTGCQGEMSEKEFNIYIKDIDGDLILDEKMKSQSNGFIDLWLPRDKKYHITISHNGKKVESAFSTFEWDGTCITTMQLM